MTSASSMASLYLAFSSAIRSFVALRTPIGDDRHDPWTTSALTLCSMSGSAMVMLKETVGILP